MKNENAPEVLQEIAAACGGRITEVSGPLPDGSGFAVMSMPLPEDHWLYGQQDNIPPGQFGDGEVVILSGDSLLTYKRFLDARKMLGAENDAEPLSRRDLRNMIREAGMYAVRTSTGNGKDMDFDPDAMLINLVIGFIGSNADLRMEEIAAVAPGESARQ